MKNRLILLACWLAVYCSFTLFAPPLLDDADSVHAEVAREMLVRHDFVTLHANGIRYLEKAPLYYWSMAASFRLFGVSTAAARVPLALAMLLLALLLESFARRAFSSQAGLYAGLIALSSFGLFIFSRIDIPDILVCDWLVLALYAFWRTEAEAVPSRRWCWVFAVACALNILTKGLIGIVFPAGIVAAYLMLARRTGGSGVTHVERRLFERFTSRPSSQTTRGWMGHPIFRGTFHPRFIGRSRLLTYYTQMRQFHPFTSTALFLALAVPWHVLAALANPAQGNPGGVAWTNGHFTVPLPTDGNVHGWAWFYFVNEQALRYLNLRVPRDYDTVPLWLFLGLIFVWLLPWSVFLPTALARALKDRKLKPINLLLLLWTAIPLAFFCFSTRQEYYVLPALPPLILLIAQDEALASSRRIVSRAMLAAGALAAAIALYFLIHAKPPAANTDLASLLSQNPADYALSFGHFLDLNARALGFFRLSLWLVVATWLGGAIAYFLLCRGGKPRLATLSLAATSFVFLFASWKALAIFSPVLSSERLALAIGPQLRAGDMIAIHGEYEAGSTLGFYLRRDDLHLVEGRSSNLWYGSFFPDAPKVFETRESIAAKWRGPRRIFLWQDPSDPDRPPLALPGPVYGIASSGGKQILSNQPAEN
jgi:4-amino-4-deoxy-L-arabinose transferase-like glycosyltransferase